jgi:hypothetical protein
LLKSSHQRRLSHGDNPDVFDTLDWPSSILGSGPPPTIKRKPTLSERIRWWRQSAKEKSHCGIIRRNTAGIRVWRRVDPGIARKLGVHRRLVREALISAVPVRKPVPKRKRPRIGPVMDSILGLHPGRGPQGAAQTAAHGPSHLRPPLPGAAKLAGVGVQHP